MHFFTTQTVWVSFYTIADKSEKWPILQYFLVLIRFLYFPFIFSNISMLQYFLILIWFQYFPYIFFNISMVQYFLILIWSHQLGEHSEWCKHTNYEVRYVLRLLLFSIWKPYTSAIALALSFFPKVAARAPLIIRAPGLTDQGRRWW